MLELQHTERRERAWERECRCRGQPGWKRDDASLPPRRASRRALGARLGAGPGVMRTNLDVEGHKGERVGDAEEGAEVARVGVACALVVRRRDDAQDE